MHWRRGHSKAALAERCWELTAEAPKFGAADLQELLAPAIPQEAQGGAVGESSSGRSTSRWQNRVGLEGAQHSGAPGAGKGARWLTSLHSVAFQL
jgi:hypothetical protein